MPGRVWALRHEEFPDWYHKADTETPPQGKVTLPPSCSYLESVAGVEEGMNGCRFESSDNNLHLRLRLQHYRETQHRLAAVMTRPRLEELGGKHNADSRHGAVSLVAAIAAAKPPMSQLSDTAQGTWQAVCACCCCRVPLLERGLSGTASFNSDYLILTPPSIPSSLKKTPTTPPTT